jgi:hypothetical protein
VWYGRFLVLLPCGCAQLFGFDAPAVRDLDAAAMVDELPVDEPAQHDEDGDGLSDDVDLCPTRPESNSDSDGDGVGDPCDPISDVKENKLLLFASFERDAADFTTTGVAVSGDAASFSSLRTAAQMTTVGRYKVISAEVAIGGVSGNGDLTLAAGLVSCHYNARLNTLEVEILGLGRTLSALPPIGSASAHIRLDHSQLQPKCIFYSGPLTTVVTAMDVASLEDTAVRVGVSQIPDSTAYVIKSLVIYD